MPLLSHVHPSILYSHRPPFTCSKLTIFVKIVNNVPTMATDQRHTERQQKVHMVNKSHLHMFSMLERATFCWIKRAVMIEYDNIIML